MDERLPSAGPGPWLRYASRGLNIIELWFDEAPPAGFRPDIIRYVQAPVPPGPGYADFFTLVVDLWAEDAALLAAMDKDTRYEIRRAEQKDGLASEAWDRASPAFLSEFAAYYDAFAALKGLPAIDSRRLRRLADAGRLDLSRVRDQCGAVLVWHAHYRHRNRVRLLHSASHFRGSDDKAFRSLVGRANRLLHWLDMRRFEAEGVRWYDWGGWYDGKDDPALLRINAFKEGFGGQVQHTYNGEVLVSMKARVFAKIARLLGKR